MLDSTPKTPEQRRQAIEAELRALPELDAPDAVWQSIESRVDSATRPKRRFLHRAFAVGAAAALAAMVLVVDRNPERGAPRSERQSTPDALVAELMEHSRLVEESRRRSVPLIKRTPVKSFQPIEAPHLLTARIAAVDASLNRLAATGTADPAAHEQLWRERVELMDTVMRAEQVRREQYLRRVVH